MKIIFIGQKGFPAKGGGVENYVHNLALGLIKKGHEVISYTRKYYASGVEYKGVKIIETPSLKSKNLDAISHTFTSIIHSLFIKNIDIIHINSVGPGLLIPFIKLSYSIKSFFSGHRPKIVFTFHSADWEHGKWSKFAKIMLKTGAYFGCHFADEVVTVSKSLKQVARKEIGIDATYIPNGTNWYKISSDKLIKNFGLEKEGYIVFIARLVPHKNVHILIDAYKKMSNHFGKKLVIVGGSANTDEYVEVLKNSIKGNSNIIMTGHQSGNTLKQLFANAACYVLPSSSEGLSISLLEAGSFALPIVISDIKENKEIVGEYGYVAKKNSIISLKNQLENLFNDYDLAKERAVLLQNQIRKEYSWDKIVKATELLYERDSYKLRGAPINQMNLNYR